MELNKDYITVSQYAKVKGITKQAVYKQLNNHLKDSLIMVDNKKCIKIEALNEVEKQQLNQVEQPFNEVEQPFNNHFQPLFEKELEEKNKTIESLLRQIESLQEQNGKLTELLSNSQYLLAAEQKKALELTQPQETKQETIEITPSAESKEEKKGFLWRLKKTLEK